MKNHASVPALATVLLFSLAGLPQAIAQPRITKQPASIAAVLGGSATLQVTASAPTPLTFQWQFNGADLAGAISNRLTLTNVILSDLGVYRVIVRDGSSEAATQPAWLKLARWTEVVAFGDSACMAQYSNGRSWVDWLGELLCLSAPNQIKNYAVGGAGTLAVRSQINQSLSANTPGTNTLLAPWFAGVSIDLINHSPVQQVVSNYATNIFLLAQAGGRAFILPTVLPIYLNPSVSGDAYLRSIDYPDLNVRMDLEIQKLKADFGLTIFRFDFYDLCLRIWANPTAYGFTNLTNAANACVGCDPNQYLWWDGTHSTTAGHRLIAQEMYRCLTPPLVIAQPTGGASGVLELRWQGGSPPFQVQRCADLTTGAWQSDELSFATNATTVSSASQRYFRVLQLGQ